ncbi:hypothetical protein J5N97_028254 [Dioscorea zingiberensis]|uniref:Uncharacterized protein n=1 Tax=Dioscorea zingiberensis TaxID=325984 RepID=A0A9D5BZ59_9LILI|nr:hypothetical protein J5N97_028254 [Dioscorea zingiberensis]
MRQCGGDKRAQLLLDSKIQYLSFLPDLPRRPYSTHSPSLLHLFNSSNIWPQSNFASDTIIIVLDTGVYSHNHPSFSDSVLPSPPSSWPGSCYSGLGFPFSSYNRKHIGARFFFKGYEAVAVSHPSTNPVNLRAINVDKPPAEEEFIESDYDLPAGDKDYQQVINEQRDKKKGDRPATAPLVNPVTCPAKDLDVGEDSESDCDSYDDLFTEPESEGEGQISFAIHGETGEITGGNIEEEVQGNTPANVGARRQKYTPLRRNASQSQVTNHGPIFNVNISRSSDVSVSNVGNVTHFRTGQS